MPGPAGPPAPSISSWPGLPPDAFPRTDGPRPAAAMVVAAAFLLPRRRRAHFKSTRTGACCAPFRRSSMMGAARRCSPTASSASVGHGHAALPPMGLNRLAASAVRRAHLAERPEPPFPDRRQPPLIIDPAARPVGRAGRAADRLVRPRGGGLLQGLRQLRDGVLHGRSCTTPTRPPRLGRARCALP